MENESGEFLCGIGKGESFPDLQCGREQDSVGSVAGDIEGKVVHGRGGNGLHMRKEERRKEKRRKNWRPMARFGTVLGSLVGDSGHSRRTPNLE